MAKVTTKKLTPVLIVEAIEPCLPLWVDRLGWAKIAEVPERREGESGASGEGNGPGGTLGFVILAKDGAELMYQTWSSVEEDLGARRPRPGGTSVGLFIEVTNIDEIERQIAGLEIVLPRRRTFYGMDEIGIVEAGGHTVVFAQPAAAA